MEDLNKNKLEELAELLHQNLSQKTKYFTIGIGNDCLIVYAKSTKLLKYIPENIENVPIKTVITGILKPVIN